VTKAGLNFKMGFSVKRRRADGNQIFLLGSKLGLKKHDKLLEN
jgi:hypothetical protein